MNCGEYPEDKSIPIVNEGFRFETSTDGSGRVVCENVVFIGGRLYACDAKLIQPVIKALEEERESIRTEAHRLLREKTEQFIEMSKRIEKLEDQVTEVCKEQRIFDKALDLATATTTFRNWLLERAKQELESET